MIMINLIPIFWVFTNTILLLLSGYIYYLSEYSSRILFLCEISMIISIIFSLFLLKNRKYIGFILILLQILPIIFISQTIILYEKLEIIGFQYKLSNNKLYSSKCLSKTMDDNVKIDLRIGFCEIIFPYFREVDHYIYYDSSDQIELKSNLRSADWNKVMQTLDRGNQLLHLDVPTRRLGRGFYDLSIDLNDGDRS